MLIFEPKMAPYEEFQDGAFDLRIKATEKMTGSSAEVQVAVELNNSSSMKKDLPKDAEESNPYYDEKLELDEFSEKSISEQKN